MPIGQWDNFVFKLIREYFVIWGRTKYLFDVVGITRVRVWFIRCLHDAWNRLGILSQIENGTVSVTDRLVGLGMILARAARPCVAFLLPLQFFFPFLENGTTEINYSSPGWTIDSFCFPGVTAHFVLKVGLWICVLGLRDTYYINKYLSCRCTVINLILFLLIFIFSKLYMYSKLTCNKMFKSLNKYSIWFLKIFAILCTF